jgi:hypothetical protein
MTVYGPRCNVHPDRIGSAKTAPNRLIIVHTSESTEGALGAENLCNYLKNRGDRTSASGNVYGSSYHYLADTDRVLPAVPDHLWAFAAAGANNDGIHICIPGRAGQTREQWLDEVSRGAIRQTAGLIHDKCQEYGIPKVRLNVAQIQAGQKGYCGHYDISRAYHQSSHTDPGPAFPWDVLAQDIADIGTPLPPPPPPAGDDMELHRRPPRIYSSDPTDGAQTTDPLGPFRSGDVRQIKLPLKGFRQARVQVTVRPIDGAGWLRVGPGGEDLRSGAWSNLNWALAQAESSPVDVVLDGEGDTLAIMASNHCHVVVDWLGWLV